MRRLPLYLRVGGPVLALAMVPGAVGPLERPGDASGAAPPFAGGSMRSAAAEKVSSTAAGSAGGAAGRSVPAAGRSVPAAGRPMPGDSWAGLPACDPARGSDPTDMPAATVSVSDREDAWWRLDPVLDESGWLTGQRLHVGRLAAGVPRTLRTFDLPAESFAAGPVGGRIIVATDDGNMSALSVLDLGRSCRTEVAIEPDVVRRAVLAPDEQTMVEFRVDRVTRADLGVWRRDLAIPGAATPVVGPLQDDPSFGPTWTTELTLDASGEQLVIESCGERACRLRVVDLVTGTLTLHADPELGELVGIAAGRVYVRAACPGLPCPVLALEAAAEPRVVVEAAGSAVLADEPDGMHLLAESPDGRHVLAIDPASGAVVRSVALDPGMRLVPAPSRSLSGVEIRAAPGRSARPGMATPDGRIGDGTPLRVLDPALPAFRDLEEVTR